LSSLNLCISSRTLKVASWQARTTRRLHHHIPPRRLSLTALLLGHSTVQYAANQSTSNFEHLHAGLEALRPTSRRAPGSLGDRGPQPTKGGRWTEGQTCRRYRDLTSRTPWCVWHDQNRGGSCRGTAKTFARLRRSSGLQDIVGNTGAFQEQVGSNGIQLIFPCSNARHGWQRAR